MLLVDAGGVLEVEQTWHSAQSSVANKFIGCLSHASSHILAAIANEVVWLAIILAKPGTTKCGSDLCSVACYV